MERVGESDAMQLEGYVFWGSYARAALGGYQHAAGRNIPVCRLFFIPRVATRYVFLQRLAPEKGIAYCGLQGRKGYLVRKSRSFCFWHVATITPLVFGGRYPMVAPAGPSTIESPR